MEMASNLQTRVKELAELNSHLSHEIGERQRRCRSNNLLRGQTFAQLETALNRIAARDR